MDNTINNEDSTVAAKSAARVSYTINNEQPVISTFIGAQPLFYMDYSEDALAEDEEFMFDNAELGLLENELASLSKEIKTLDTLSSEYSRSPEDNIDIFTEARDSIIEVKADSAPKTTVEEIRAILKSSRLAQAYLDHAEKFGVEIVLTGQVASAVYDRKSSAILINENLSQASQLLLASRELRRHWQHRQGALLNPMSFHPDSAIVINRAQNADLIASVIRVAWEIQLSGQKEAWEYIENSSFADLGRAFTREAYLDFRTINNGQAATAVFEAWFLSERCRAEDRILIRQMLADQEGYVFDAEGMHTAITPTLIAALGEMPFGKNYLAKHADTIITDPIFNEVRDRSNANFLWFIKFERTFRETERDLQTKFSSATDDSVGASTTKQQDLSDEQKIVTLYDAAEQPKRTEGQLLSDNGSQRNPQEDDNIVYLRSIPEGRL